MSLPIGDWEQKVWGRTRCLARNESNGVMVHVHQLEIKAGSWCSVHWHKAKTNLFICLSGKLRVVRLRGNSLTVDELYNKGSLLVPEREIHQFQALTDCEVVEEYRAPHPTQRFDEYDIIRLTEGNCDGVTTLEPKTFLLTNGAPWNGNINSFR